AEAIAVNAGEAPRPVIQADGTLYAATLDGVAEPAGYAGFLEVTISQPGTYWLMSFEDRDAGIANLMWMAPLEGAAPVTEFTSCKECHLASHSASVISSYHVGAGNYEVYLRSDYGQMVYFAIVRGE